MSGAYFFVESSTRAPLPEGAIQGGTDTDGSPIYVGLASYQGDELPCKVVPNRHAAYVSWNGNEHQVTHYKVMCERSRLHWVRNHGGAIPHNAVQAGRTSRGELLYVGRAHHNRGVIVGKVHPSHHCCYIPYGGKEHSYKEYEILVVR